MAKNRLIGNSAGQNAKEQIPWHIPEDIKRFKELTTGHIVVMGRTTYQSINKPLPNRTNIVLTRDADWTAEGVITCNSVAKVLNWCELNQKPNQKVFIIGGAQIYTQFLPFADQLDLTLVDGQYEGDIFFPEFADSFKLVEKNQKDGYSFDKYIRK